VLFPELAKSPLIISGESYGGLYTPHLAALVVEHNKQATEDAKINFQGLAVGDPCINWEAQMPTYPHTLYGMGVLMADERADLAARMALSVKQLKAGNCPAAFNIWNTVWDDNGGLGPSEGHGWFANTTGSFNTENILMGNSPLGWGNMETFWAKPVVRAAFHVNGVPSPTNGTAAEVGIKVYNAFVQSGDWCSNSSYLYSQLLRDTSPGIDLMIYSSTADPLLGPPTTEAGIYAILDDAAAHSDSGRQIQASFLAAKKKVWFVNSTIDKQPAGYAKCSWRGGSDGHRFCYAVIRNAGHEAPGYQPRAAFDMINRFASRRQWDSSGDRAVPECSECSGVGPFAGAALPQCHAK